MKFPDVFYVELTYFDSGSVKDTLSVEISTWPELRTPFIYGNRAKSSINIKKIVIKYDYDNYLRLKNKEYIKKIKT